LPVWVANLYLWHIPFMFQGALDHEAIHIFQHMMFFAVGFNMWMPLFGPLPKPAWFGNIAKLFYVVAVRLGALLLGNVFVFASRPFYGSYEHATSFWGLSPAADQSTAGAVMMIEGSLISFGLFAWLFVKAAREGQESQDLVEMAREHGVELTPERSARAVAAGTSELLRERIVAGKDASEFASNDQSEHS
jgi:cytochrome c oxidase assembly factor CtaG